MRLLSLHPRDSDGRAARRVGVVALILAVGVAAAGLLGARLGLWGPAASRLRAGRGAVGDRGVAIDSAERSAAETGRPQAGRDASGRAAVGSDPARGQDGGPGEGDRPRDALRAEDLLRFLDHMENQVAAVVERARESVVALEYSASEASAVRRRASGVVINDGGEILSVRIDPPRSVPAGGPGAADKKRRDPMRIVAHDYLGRTHLARWVASDPHTGLTLLRVSRGAVRPIRAAADGPKLSSPVFVVGNPFGLGHSVKRGYVAGLERVLKLKDRQLGGLIQVQAPLYPGDSGAAVVDVRGDWLGLIRCDLAIPGSSARPSAATDPPEVGQAIAPRAADHRDAANDGADRAGEAEADPSAEPDIDFGFAIPTGDALWVAEQLQAHRRVDRAYLGVRLEKMGVAEEAIPAPSAPAASPPSASGPEASGSWRGGGGGSGSSDVPPGSAPAAAAGDLDPPRVVAEGARILSVEPGTPAAKAGLRAGDRIVALDGRPIRSRSQLIDRLDRILARKDIVLDVVRGGDSTRSRLTVTVRTASRPDPADSVAGAGAVTPPERRSGGAGVDVTPTASHVEPAAPAAAGGTNPSPPAAGGSGPSPSPSGEARSDPPAAPPSSPAPRQDPPPAQAPAVPNRPEPPPPAASSTTSPGELRQTLPRAVVERIEHLERRVVELEQFRTRAGARPGATDEPDSRAQPAPPRRERAGRPSGPSTP